MKTILKFMIVLKFKKRDDPLILFLSTVTIESEIHCASILGWSGTRLLRTMGPL